MAAGAEVAPALPEAQAESVAWEEAAIGTMIGE